MQYKSTHAHTHIHTTYTGQTQQHVVPNKAVSGDGGAVLCNQGVPWIRVPLLYCKPTQLHATTFGMCFGVGGGLFFLSVFARTQWMCICMHFHGCVFLNVMFCVRGNVMGVYVACALPQHT